MVVDLLRDYIRAKDENRPHLIPQVFAANACLEMRVKTDSIAFPAVSQGAATIADVLVRRLPLGLVDVAIALQVAPRVAEIMAAELGWDAQRVASELEYVREYLRGWMAPAD